MYSTTGAGSMALFHRAQCGWGPGSVLRVCGMDFVGKRTSVMRWTSGSSKAYSRKRHSSSGAMMVPVWVLDSVIFPLLSDCYHSCVAETVTPQAGSGFHGGGGSGAFAGHCQGSTVS